MDGYNAEGAEIDLERKNSINKPFRSPIVVSAYIQVRSLETPNLIDVDFQFLHRTYLRIATSVFLYIEFPATTVHEKKIQYQCQHMLFK